MILVVWKYAKMHQNMFVTTPDVQKYLFWKIVSGGLEVCANASKHVFNHSRRSKISFWANFPGGLEVCENTSNTFLTTLDGKKYLFSEHFSGGLEVCKNASKRVFNHYRLSKISCLKKSFCWSKRYFWKSGVVKSVFWCICKYSQNTRNFFSKKLFLKVWSG